jgi:DNA-directed RNA polymerase specialized sigma24 family protein
MKDWEPPPEAWEKFLNLLDEAPDKAGDKYEEIRARLITFFECRRCLAVERLADISINRVIKRYFEGEIIAALMGYVFGVAKIVYFEYLAEQRNEKLVRDEFTRAGEGVVEPDLGDDEPDVVQRCFDGCMAKLEPDDRAFIKRYYEESRRKKIKNRKSMAEELNISRNAVVLRAFHVRQRLKRCVDKCLKKHGGG